MRTRRKGGSESICCLPTSSRNMHRPGGENRGENEGAAWWWRWCHGRATTGSRKLTRAHVFPFPLRISRALFVNCAFVHRARQFNRSRRASLISPRDYNENPLFRRMLRSRQFFFSFLETNFSFSFFLFSYFKRNLYRYIREKNWEETRVLLWNFPNSRDFEGEGGNKFFFNIEQALE